MKSWSKFSGSPFPSFAIRVREWSLFLVATLVLTSVFYWIYLSSNVWSSGYHLADDHSMVLINLQLQAADGSIWAVFTEWLGSDLSSRFRSFYWFHRVLIIDLLGIDFNAHMVYVGHLGIVTALLLYAFGRVSGLPFLAAVFLPLLTLVGAQSEVWWRLGPGESLAMVALSAALLFMALANKQTRQRTLWLFLFGAFASVASLTKESFILVLPALAFWNVALYRAQYGHSWKACYDDNRWITIFLLALCIAEIAFIKVLGVRGPGYTGIQWDLVRFIEVGAELGGYAHAWVMGVLVVALGIALHRSKGVLEWKSVAEAILIPMVLLVLISGPQIILYSKSGIGEYYRYRYILPGILGFSFLTVSILALVIRRSLLIGIAAALALVAPVYWNAGEAYKQAFYHALNGITLNEAFRLVTDNTEPGESVAIAVDPGYGGEWVRSSKIFLQAYFGVEDFQYVFVRDPNYPPLRERAADRMENRYWDLIIGASRSEPRFGSLLVIQAPIIEERFLEMSRDWFDPDRSYERHPLGWYTVYTRRR